MTSNFVVLQLPTKPIKSRLHDSVVTEEYATEYDRDLRYDSLESDGMKPMRWTQHDWEYGTGVNRGDTFAVSHYIREGMHAR